MNFLTRAVRLGSGLVLCSLTATAVAQVLPDAIRACKSEPDAARRLQCYDREVAKFPLTSEQSFGLSGSQVAAAQNQSSNAATTVKYLTARVVAMRDRPHAGFVATLDSGQVWVQNEFDSTRHIDVGDVVTIRPGLLGSYWLEGPSGWATKAHRVQ